MQKRPPFSKTLNPVLVDFLLKWNNARNSELLSYEDRIKEAYADFRVWIGRQNQEQGFARIAWRTRPVEVTKAFIRRLIQEVKNDPVMHYETKAMAIESIRKTYQLGEILQWRILGRDGQQVLDPWGLRDMQHRDHGKRELEEKGVLPKPAAVDTPAEQALTAIEAGELREEQTGLELWASEQGPGYLAAFEYIFLRFPTQETAAQAHDTTRQKLQDALPPLYARIGAIRQKFA